MTYMGKKGTVESPDGSWLVTWSTFWWHIDYVVQDQETGDVFQAIPSGDEGWYLGPIKEFVRRDDPDFQPLLETLQRAWEAASES
jgi:hypothetical protein